LIQREDDQETTIRKRMEVYRQQTAPLVDYYGKAGLLRSVDGMLPITQVGQALLAVLESTP
jgi:adenylate kinase